MTASAPVLPDSFVLVGSDKLRETTGGTIDSVSAVTGRPQGRVVLAGGAEVDAAVDAAATAQRSWVALPGGERRLMLRLLADVLRDNADEIDGLQVLEA